MTKVVQIIIHNNKANILRILRVKEKLGEWLVILRATEREGPLAVIVVVTVVTVPLLLLPLGKERLARWLVYHFSSSSCLVLPNTTIFLVSHELSNLFPYLGLCWKTQQASIQSVLHVLFHFPLHKAFSFVLYYQEAHWNVAVVLIFNPYCQHFFIQSKCYENICWGDKTNHLLYLLVHLDRLHSSVQ